MSDVDVLNLAFEPETLVLLNVVIGLIMFGVALDLKMADFKDVVRNPKGVTVGLTA